MRALLIAVLAAPAVASAPESFPPVQASAVAAVRGALADLRALPPFEDEPGPGDESKERGGAPKRFRLVSPGLYRSAQPDDEDFAWLASAGVRSILDLRGSPSGPLERWQAGRCGLRVESVPMSGLREPSFAQMDRALAVLTDPALPRPVLVHCLHGQDRTGLVVAAYRAVVEGAPLKEAAREARDLGCCHTVSGDPEDYLTRYLRHRASVAGAR